MTKEEDMWRQELAEQKGKQIEQERSKEFRRERQERKKFKRENEED